MQIVNGKPTSMFSFQSLKAFPGLTELPGGSARSEVIEGVGARRRLCWALLSSLSAGTPVDMIPQEQTCLARCWAGDRAMLQLNTPAFSPDAPPQTDDCCCGTDILEALAPPGQLHIHLPLAALVPCHASVVGKLQLIQTKPWQAPHLP